MEGQNLSDDDHRNLKSQPTNDHTCDTHDTEHHANRHREDPDSSYNNNANRDEHDKCDNNRSINEESHGKDTEHLVRRNQEHHIAHQQISDKEHNHNGNSQSDKNNGHYTDNEHKNESNEHSHGKEHHVVLLIGNPHTYSRLHEDEHHSHYRHRHRLAHDDNPHRPHRRRLMRHTGGSVSLHSLHRDSGEGDGSHTPLKERHLYRQGSLGSQWSDTDGTPMKNFDRKSHPSGASVRTRTPSGKSIRSRTASRAEYHHDLHYELESGLTRNLIFASFLIYFGSSFLFGYNIGVLNQPVELIKEFYNETYTERYGEISDGMLTFLWSLTTALFLPGGMIGAFSAGFLADRFGRKYATMLSMIFAFIGAVVSTVCLAAKAPELLMIGRFFTGIHCGFATQLPPMYLSEIVPVNLRGAFGTGHQLFITIGIFFSAILGLREILGTTGGWPYLLLMNAAPAFISLVLMPIIPESPRFLMLNRRNRIAAEKALRFYRQKLNVIADIEEMETEMQDCGEASEKKEEEHYTMKKLFQTKALHMPLLVACMLQVVQQFSGINAIFFYSTGIYKNAGVPDPSIQYAVLGTNAVNVIMTLIAVPIMDKAGRRPLVLYPMIAMNVILILITISLNLQNTLTWMTYISILCVILYVICFAVGLGPVPMMIGAELFRQGPRPRAMSCAGLTNWICTFIVAISFESIQKACTTFTFLVFLGLMIIFTVFVFFKVPETKNKTFEEIATQFMPGGEIEVEEIVDDVFPEEDEAEEGARESSPMMNGQDKKRHISNGSIPSNAERSIDNVKVNIPEERVILTRSKDHIGDVNA